MLSEMHCGDRNSVRTFGMRFALPLLLVSHILPVRSQKGCSTLVGASLTWSMVPNPTTNVRSINLKLRTAFDVTSCQSCNFNLGSSPASVQANQICDDFGRICVHKDPLAYLSCDLTNTVGQCDQSFSNNNMKIISYHGDLYSDPSGIWQSKTVSIGTRQVISGELNIPYSIDSTSAAPQNFLEVWYNFTSAATNVAIVVPTYKTVIPLTAPQNYYSPQPMQPLFVPIPQSGYQVNFKAFDYDGHPMIVEIDSLSPVAFSDAQTRNISIGGCCQCPSSLFGSGTTRYAFFDLATDPHAFVGPSTYPSWDGPVISNRSTAATKTIDALPASPKSTNDFMRIRIFDAIFNAIWNSPLSNDRTSYNQLQAFSTTVETFFLSVRNPVGCGAAQTPLFLAPTVTEFTCPYDQIGNVNGPCNEIQLLVNSSSSDQPARIVPAVGFPDFDTYWVAGESASEGSALYNVLSSSSTTSICTTCQDSTYSRQRCPCFCPEVKFSLKRCWYRIPAKTVADVGTFVVQCFMAVRRKVSSSLSLATDSCYSAPLCIKVYIAGNSPAFVSPTPLSANSENDNGVLIQGRTDVPACLGYPMQLNVTAMDRDVGDTVRIFVNDTEGIFLATSQLSLDTTDCTTGIIQPYLAERVGDNQNQSTDYAISNGGSIAATFKAEISFTAGTASQQIQYTLNSGTGYQALPRPKLNRNLIICGRAYDQSRLRYQRWVGKRFDPLVVDYSYGDYRSDEQCWRINLQAPPQIKQTSVTTVINQQTSTYAQDQNGQYKVPAGTGNLLNILISADDPNSNDRTQILLLGSTGLPVGAFIASLSCNATIICSAEDLALTASAQLSAELKQSDCSSVDFNIRWDVSTTDVGKVIRICAIPRDSSTLCVGTAADAATTGWYGENTCLNFNVSAPQFTWTINDEFTLYDITVGCMFTFRVGLKQSTQGYTAQILLADAPNDASIVNSVISVSPTDDILGTIYWAPSRGTEGQIYDFCVIGSVSGVSATEPKCFRAQVGKCRYCVEGSVLETVRVNYNIDTNWLRLWTLNADTSSGLGLVSSCIPQLNCNSDSNSTVINNPYLVASTSGEKRIIWAGTLLQTTSPENLVEIAGKFHTTVKSLLSVNPDLKSASIRPSDEICVVPCNQM